MIFWWWHLVVCRVPVKLLFCQTPPAASPNKIPINKSSFEVGLHSHTTLPPPLFHLYLLSPIEL